MILMKVHTLQLHLLTVQQETLLGIERYLTDACCGLISVCYFSILDDGGFHLIQIRVCNVPEVWTLYRDALLATLCLLGHQIQGRRLTFAYFFATGIQQTLHDLTLLRLESAVADLCLNAKFSF